MHLDYFRLANSVWILVGIYWAYTSMHSKPVARREHSTGRALHVLWMALAAFLLFSSHISIGLLASRFVPETSWICTRRARSHGCRLRLRGLGTRFSGIELERIRDRERKA